MKHAARIAAFVLATALLALAATVLMPAPSLSLYAAAATVAQEPDTDGDTMPDAWETFFGLDPDDPADASGDLDGDGLTNAQEFAARRHPLGRHVRYFAEGSTGFFDTSVSLLNLSATEPAHVAIALLRESGGVTSHQVLLAPRQRQTVSINAVLGMSAAVAIVVESDVPVAADRWMTWGNSGIGATLDSGAPAPATTWYFAEGATGSFLLFYLFENPGTTPANVTIRYLVEGAAPVSRTRTLPPQSRTTVFVNDDDPALRAASVGSVITSDVPIFAERAMYANAGGRLGGGSASAGSNTVSTQWYFGEGSTGLFFHCFLAMLNPGAQPATATVTYHLSDGSTVAKPYLVPAGGRRTVYFNAEAALDPALAALGHGPVWFTVESTQPILGERAMWWPTWPWYEGHAAPGSTTRDVAWAVPGGRHGGPTQEETYVLIGNTTATPGQLRLTLIPDAGAPMTRELPIGASERLTVNAGRLFGLTADTQFSVIVESLGAPATPLAVDYARYRSVNRIPFSGGGAAPAIPVPPADAAPSVTSTTPAANATGVALDANLTVTFSEPVTADAGAFVLECPAGTPIALTNLTASPATTFTLDPGVSLPASTACRLRIVASEISDADATDPPDELAADVTVPFTSACPTIVVSPTTVPGGTINVAYASVQFTQTGGTAPIAWTVSAGALPAGMNLSAAGLLAGTPTVSGPFSFTVTATDANTCPASVPLSLSILAEPNHAPSFTAGANQTVLEDAGAQTVAAWATGISPGPPTESGQTLTFVVNGNTNPALFAAGPAISATGTLTYTPAANANGTATIEIVLQDNGGTLGGGDDTSDPQSVTIAVTAVNDAPSFTLAPVPTVLEDAGPQSVALVTTFSPGPADEAAQTVAFTLSANTNPALFAAGPAVASDGTLTYTPAPNASGTATITITAQDTGGTANGGADTSVPQSFTIGVTAVNDPPAAVADAATTDEDTALSVPAPGVLANDLDADAGDTRTVAAVDGNAAAVGTSIALASGALLTVNADGSFGYDPRPAAAFQALGASQSATDSFAYTMQDALGVTSTATVSLTIAGVNDAPTLDLDLDDDGGTPPTTGTGFAITLTEGAPPAFIEDEIDATITDVDSLTLSSITVTLTNLLDPTFEILDVDLATGGFDVTFTKAYDTATDPTRGVLIITANTPQPIASFNTLLRRVTYDNNDVDPDTTARLIEFVVNDGAGDSNTATSTVAVVAVPNSPPTAVDDPGYSVNEGGTLNVSGPGVLGNDTDPDGDTLRAVLVSGPAHAASFTLNDDGSFTYVHDGIGSDDVTFTYLAEDVPGAQSAVATVTITVSDVNDAPSFTGGGDVTVLEDSGAFNAAWATAISAGEPLESGQTLTFVVTNNSNPALFTGGGLPAVNAATGNLTFTPAANASGSATITIRLDDNGPGTPPNQNQSPTQTFVINVTGVNDAPAGTNNAVTILEDAPRAFTAADFGFTDPNDTPANALLSVRITTLPAAGSLTLSGSPIPGPVDIAVADLPNLVFTPAANASGSPYTSFTFQVRDNGGTADGGVDLDQSANTFTFNVTALNDPPAGTDTTVTTDEDVQYTFTPANFGFTDPNDTPVNAFQSVVITTLPAAGSLTLSGVAVATGAEIPVASITAGNLRYLSPLNAFGSPFTTFTFQVRDNGGTANGGVDLDPSANAMTINVNPVNDAPLVANETFDVLGNTELRVDRDPGTTPNTTETTPNTNPAVEGVLDNDSDPEGNLIVVTAIGGGCADTTAPFDCTLTGGAVIHVEANGEFSYTPAPGATTGSFTYTVTDQPLVGVAANVTGTVTFTIVEQIWYVDADAAAGGNGTSLAPFNTFGATTLNGVNGAGDLDDADDYIFVHSATAAINAGIELEGGQHLIGEPVGLSIPRNLNANGSPTVVVPVNAALAPPVINGGAGNSVTVTEAMPAEIRGLTLGSLNAVDVTTDAPLTGSTSLTIANNVINGATAEGIDVNLNAGTTGTLSLAITGNSWNLAGSHAGNAVDISRAAGTLNLNFSNNTNIVSAGAAVAINGGAAANTFITGFANNTIHGNTAGAGVSIANVTFDAVPTTGPIDTVNGGTLAIGASGNAVGGAGAVFSPVAGSLSLGDLDVFGGTSGLTTAGLNLAVSPNVGTISAANGVGVDVSAGTLDLRLSALTVTTTAAGVSLNALAAGSQFSAPSGSSISKTSGSGTAFSVASSNVAMSYAGSLNVTSGSGVSLTSNNAASTFTFSGGMTLSTGANPAFTATGGGTVNVCDENPCVPAATGSLANTLTTTTATALNVTNMTIGANNLEFRSISSNGGSSTGIIVDNTGTTGGLKVKGNGTAGSGGTVANKTGADGSTSTGIGIYLNATANVSLDRMQLNDFDNYAIRGLNVNGFALSNSVVNAATGTNGTNVGVDEGSVSFGVRFGTTGLVGTASVVNTTLEDGVEDTFSVFNTSGTLTLTMDNVSVSGSGNDGVVTQNAGTATVNIEVRNSDFSANIGDHFGATADVTAGVGSANLNVQFSNNTLTGGAAGALGQSLGVQTGVAWGGTGTAVVSNNTINGAVDTPININIGGTGTFAATVSGNTIGTSGVAGSGTPTGSNKDAIRIVANGDGSVDATPDGGTFTALVTNNTIQQVSGRGIFALARDGGTAVDPIQLNLTITGNLLRQSLDSNGQGIRVEAGATSSDDVRVHADIGGAGALANNFTDDWGVNGSGGTIDFDEIRITHGFSALCQFILNGLGANTSSVATVNTYLTGRNTLPGGGAGVASSTLSGGGVYETGGSPPVP